MLIDEEAIGVALETLEEIRVRQGLPLSAQEVKKNYIKAVDKGGFTTLLKNAGIELNLPNMNLDY